MFELQVKPFLLLDFMLSLTTNQELIRKPKDFFYHLDEKLLILDNL